ncbi:replication initiation protein [Ursidibacter sp. B-7004-1]
MNNHLMIHKANNFVQASYSMTLDEMRILSLTLGVFNPKNPSKRGFDFTVADFCNHFPDVNPDIAYTQVRNAILKISKRWVTLVDNEQELTEVALIHKRSYFKKEGRFYIEFHDELIPYISELHDNYTKYQLVNIGAFSSTHAIRLYELCSQYRDTGWRQTPLDDLKIWLQVSDKYPRYNSFNQRVLTPAVTEINAKSDLLVDVEPIKRGRIIHALKFTIKEKKQVIDFGAELTKDGLTKLPKRPQVKVGSQQEWEYWKECLYIRKADYERFKSADIRRPTKLLADLAKIYRKLNDTLKAEELEEVIESRKKNGRD